jgi:hypothetical protein
MLQYKLHQQVTEFCTFVTGMKTCIITPDIIEACENYSGLCCLYYPLQKSQRTPTGGKGK